MTSMSDNEFCDLLKSVSNGLVALENRHLFVRDFVDSLDKYVIPSRRPVVKRFLMMFLKQFSSSKDRSVHFETFPLWLKLAKYSETMGTRQILDQVAYLYADYVPYYHAYIEELLSKNQEAEALKMVAKCKDNCSLTSQQIAEEFPMLKLPPVKSLGATPDTLGKTMISVNFTDETEHTICEQTEILCLEADVTVKKLADIYKQNGGFMSMLIGSLLGAQLAQLLSKLQSGQKLCPQSVVVFEPLEVSLTPEVLVDKCILKISDSKTKNDYSTDTAKIKGFLNVVGYLLFLDSFEVVQTEEGNVPNKAISRRYVDRDLWMGIFRRLLNNNSNSTDWAALATELKEKFVQMASTKKTLWTESVNEFNKNFTLAL